MAAAAACVPSLPPQHHAPWLRASTTQASTTQLTQTTRQWWQPSPQLRFGTFQSPRFSTWRPQRHPQCSTWWLPKPHPLRKPTLRHSPPQCRSPHQCLCQGPLCLCQPMCRCAAVRAGASSAQTGHSRVIKQPADAAAGVGWACSGRRPRASSPAESNVAQQTGWLFSPGPACHSAIG